MPRQAPGQEASWQKLRLLRAVLEGRASSRREIAQLLQLRSSTVSELAGALLEAGLLSEAVTHSGGRGRPASRLIANPRRVAAVVFQVASQSIRVTVVDLAGRVFAQESVEVSGACENAGMENAFLTLFETARAHIPDGTLIAGTSFALSGLLDPSSRRWLFSSRWPRLRELDIGAAMRPTGLPVLIARNLDVELRARLAHAREIQGGTLLLHWGYGIGASYAVDGVPVNGGEGRFGEIGHWRLSRSSAAACRCGRTGCLETIAALWALHAPLQARFPSISLDEGTFAGQAADLDIMALPDLDRALDGVVTALTNLCRVLFPRRVIMSGPFTANPDVWAAFVARFHEEGVLPAVGLPVLIADQRSTALELEGAAAPLLARALGRLLTARENA